MTTVHARRRASALSSAWSWIVRAGRLELHIYASIGRAIARRRAIPRDGAGFRYHSPVLAVLIVFIVLSAVEIPIVDVIVHRWPAVRIAFLVIGIWGVTWMIGLLCAYLMRPHTVATEGIRARSGLEVDVLMPWDEIHAVAIRPRADDGGAPRITEEESVRILHLRIANETNVLIEFERPIVLDLPGRPPRGGEQLVSAVRLWADAPRAFLAAVGRHI